MSDGRSRMNTPSPTKKMKTPSVGGASVKTTKSSALAALREVDYKTVLQILRQIEKHIELFTDVYDLMIEASKRDHKIKTDFNETIKKAESERKYQKYLAQKEKEAEDAEARYQKNMERMAKKEAIHADFGKKKMLRESMPQHKKYVQKSKKVKQDVDFVKYFGDDVDFTQIPEDKPELEESKERNEDSDSDFD